MRRWAIGISGAVLVLAAIAAVAIVWGVVPHASAGVSPQPNVVAAGTVGAEAPTEGPGRHLVASAEPCSIDSAAAMDAAAKIIVPGAFLRAKNIVISKYRFTSDEVATSVVPTNALVWIVTFNGVDTPFRGGMSIDATAGTTRPVAHQLNVVIDANTGAGLLAFTGSVTR
jgi:hypothetical protein